jgi:hypothetical protein
MTWVRWIKIFGRKAQNLSIGALVYFRRGNLPELGQVVGTGNELRVPLMRSDEAGRVSTRRVYWRNRSQLYERRA